MIVYYNWMRIIADMAEFKLNKFIFRFLDQKGKRYACFIRFK